MLRCRLSCDGPDTHGLELGAVQSGFRGVYYRIRVYVKHADIRAQV